MLKNIELRANCPGTRKGGLLAQTAPLFHSGDQSRTPVLKVMRDRSTNDWIVAPYEATHYGNDEKPLSRHSRKLVMFWSILSSIVMPRSQVKVTEDKHEEHVYQVK